MKVPRNYLYAAGGGIVAAIAAYLGFRSSAAAIDDTPVPAAVAGQVTSGQRSLIIDDNILSPTFGQVLTQ
jgi:hypothetical protein